MSAYIVTEASLAARSLAFGMALMVFYDILRLLRFLIPHGELAVGLEDVGYWLFAAVMASVFLFRENDGVLRGYVIAGMFFGMILYDRIVSRNVFKLLQKMKRWIRIRVSRWSNRKRVKRK